MKVKYSIAILCLLISQVFISCRNSDEHAEHGDTAVAKVPSGHEHHGAHGMSMEPADHSQMIQLSEYEKILAGIKVDTVRMTDFNESVSALGMVAVDESTITTINAKVKGRLERLYQRNPGDEIRAGQPLYDLYSETLLAEEQDLIHLINSNAQQDFIEGAKSKLRLHGLTEAQVKRIELEKTANPRVTIYSTESGFVSSLPVREGQYVETGEILFELASLDVVRINVQVYANEIEVFSNVAVYEVTTAADPGKIYTATKAFGNPALEPNSKIMMLRLRVVNNDRLLRPGMMTTVRMATVAEKRLTIPVTAVLTENGMSFTWIMESDGMFSRRMVQTGNTNGNAIEILSGINEGDRVVTGGIYLLNSEYILRQGANTMAGMEM